MCAPVHFRGCFPGAWAAHNYTILQFIVEFDRWGHGLLGCPRVPGRTVFPALAVLGIGKFVRGRGILCHWYRYSVPDAWVLVSMYLNACGTAINSVYVYHLPGSTSTGYRTL